jgi:ketosteroid isomerase-like protein
MTETPERFTREEIEATVVNYVAVREAIERGELAWDAMAQFFTDDAVYIDPAWGRVQGIGHMTEFFTESMRGLDDWEFPIEATAVSGDLVFVKWAQITPGRKPDGTRYSQSGLSTLRYAGNGKFDYDEDLLNMTHVNEDLRASGWRPSEDFNFPPKDPNRDWSKP